jgi:hypothetical protein
VFIGEIQGIFTNYGLFLFPCLFYRVIIVFITDLKKFDIFHFEYDYITRYVYLGSNLFTTSLDSGMIKINEDNRKHPVRKVGKMLAIKQIDLDSSSDYTF